MTKEEEVKYFYTEGYGYDSKPPITKLTSSSVPPNYQSYTYIVPNYPPTVIMQDNVTITSTNVSEQKQLESNQGSNPFDNFKLEDEMLNSYNKFMDQMIKEHDKEHMEEKIEKLKQKVKQGAGLFEQLRQSANIKTFSRSQTDKVSEPKSETTEQYDAKFVHTSGLDEPQRSRTNENYSSRGYKILDVDEFKSRGKLSHYETRSDPKVLNRDDSDTCNVIGRQLEEEHDFMKRIHNMKIDW